MIKKIAISMTSIFLASCNIEKPLHQSGRYVIQSRQGTLTKLQGVRGTYEFVNDTLKAGDTIEVTMMRRRK